MSLTQSLDSLVGQAELRTTAALPGVPVACPSTVDQAREIVRMASQDKLTFALLGRGSKLGWSALVGEPKFALSTERLTGIIEFEPGDGVLTALSGTSMATLEQITRPHGLAVTPAIPHCANATLGGVIAAGQSGSDRLVNGPVRAHVLGTRLIQLNCEITRSGGRLVKNVSGYDIHRLVTGSFGSLGMITEASLRLMSIPEEQILLSREATTLDDLMALVPQLLKSITRPDLLMVESTAGDDSWKLHLAFSGRSEHMQQEREKAGDILGQVGSLRGLNAEDELTRLRNLEPSGQEGDALRMQVKRSNFSAALRQLLGALDCPQEARILGHPGLAEAHLQLSSMGISSEQLQRLRSALVTLGASIQLRRRTPLDAAHLPPIKDPVRARLSERLRATYDPQGLLCTRPPLEPAPKASL